MRVLILFFHCKRTSHHEKPFLHPSGSNDSPIPAGVEGGFRDRTVRGWFSKGSGIIYNIQARHDSKYGLQICPDPLDQKLLSNLNLKNYYFLCGKRLKIMNDTKDLSLRMYFYQ